jgi:hypothetical protein
MINKHLPKLPDHKINFENLTVKTGSLGPSKFNNRWARVIEFRPPKKGEFYLSGAIVQAFKAPNDLDSSYWIVEPIPDPVLHEYP